MKYVLFGATGQLGREWESWIRDRDFPIKFKAFSSTDADITNSIQIKTLLDDHKPEVVINCAAYTNVDEAEEERDKARDVNSIAVKSLANLCADRNIKLIHYSTDYVFPGKVEDRRTYPRGYPEDHETEPVNWYGATKLRGEQAIQEANVDYLIIRVSWLCGQFGPNFVQTMLRLARERDSLDVVNDQWGSPTFTENVVENTMALLDHDREGIYHVTSKGMISWYDYAEEIFRLTGKDIQLKPVTSDAFKTKAKRPRFSKLDTRKLQKVEGTNLIDWKKGLKKLLKQINY